MPSDKTSAKKPNGSDEAAMQTVLAAQRKAHIAEGPPSAQKRIDWINRSIALLVDHKDDIAKALSDDFGHRSTEQSFFADVMGTIGSLKHARTHLRSWMRPEKRRPQFPLGLLGARARVEFQPKGVIGVLSPWNFPINLSFAPLAGIFAAGNRVMLKPSEYTPATADLMCRMFAKAYDETEVAVFTGGPEVGQAFTRLAFDHLLYTGGTSVACHVMRAAADNLVPLTLELGGKSPVIVSKTANMEEAALKIMNGKMLNAGQICLAPDYVFMPRQGVEDFAQHAAAAAEKMYPTLKENPDYTSLVNQRHYDRLQELLQDARDKGGKIVEINPAGEDFSQQPHHKMPPALVLNPTDDMKVMQEEIFGPILPVKAYDDLNEAIEYVNKRERPLGLYYFGKDSAEQKDLLSRTTSGGVTINDVIFHVSMEDLPFGGIGPSGMGSYHGEYGFREFSHARAVFKQTPVRKVTDMLLPPYGERSKKMINSQISR